MDFNVKKLMKSQRTAVRAVKGGVEEIRLKIISKRDELAKVSVIPVPPADAIATLDSWMDKVSLDAVSGLYIRRLTQDNRLGLDFDAQLRGEAKIVDSMPFVEQLLGLLVATNSDAFRAIIKDELADFYEGRDWIDPKEKAGRLMEIEREIIVLELAEESAIREAETAGIAILRRADADPRAVLAAANELPK